MFLRGVNGMKVTKICLIDEGNAVELEKLNRLMAVFCAAWRHSYNRLVEGEQSSRLIKSVSALFHLNKRYAEDAVMQAQAKPLFQVKKNFSP